MNIYKKRAEHDVKRKKNGIKKVSSITTALLKIVLVVLLKYMHEERPQKKYEYCYDDRITLNDQSKYKLSNRSFVAVAAVV